MPVGAPGSRFALEGWREEIQENVHQNRFFPNPFFFVGGTFDQQCTIRGDLFEYGMCCTLWDSCGLCELLVMCGCS